MSLILVPIFLGKFSPSIREAKLKHGKFNLICLVFGHDRKESEVRSSNKLNLIHPQNVCHYEWCHRCFASHYWFRSTTARVTRYASSDKALLSSKNIEVHKN